MVTRALAAAAALLVLAPASASAHALLEGTTPARGARLAAAPATVTLRFSEPVEAQFGAVRVFDSRGRQVQAGRAFHPAGRGSAVAVRLRGGLGADGYTVTYRVISADSHPVAGGFVFVVGDAAAPATSVGELLDDAEAGPVTGTALGVVRAVQFAAIAVALGAVVFLLACWRTLHPPARWRAVVLVAAGAGALSAALAVILQGAVAGGTSAWEALRADVVRDVLATRFGVVWGLGALAWLGVAALAPARPRAAALPLAALAFLPALGGHAGVQSPVAVLLPANVLHVAAMSAWLGGIAMLVLAGRAVTAPVVARFSRLAGAAVAVIAITGAAQAIVEVRAFDNLLDTAFGRAVLIKVGLLAAIVALGALNRRRLKAGRALGHTVRVELALGAAVLATTGALAGYPPSTAATSGPYSTRADIGPARLELTVDPARPGPNEMHLYLFEKASGRQLSAVEELTVTAALPEKRIAPIDVQPTKAGPGHYVVSGAALGVAGDWTLTIAARVSAFDEYRTRVEVPIR